MFEGKAGDCPDEAPFRCSLLRYFSHKHWAILKRLVRDKRSNVLQKLINYGHKKFYNIGPREQYYKK
jgi:hypothetical protein